MTHEQDAFARERGREGRNTECRQVRGCICDTVQLNRPSMSDPYQPDEQKVRHPLCPHHGWQEGDPWHDWDFSAGFYGLALTYSGEWVDEDEWDAETGERKP